MTFHPKHKELLKDTKVRNWYESMRARSPISADVWLRNLGLYCLLNNTIPDAIIRDAETKKLKDQFTAFVRDLEKKGKAGSSSSF